MARLVAFSLVLFGSLAACGGGSSSYECTAETNCTQAGVVGYCRQSTASDSHYCAYPDGTCPSGERWGVLAGEGLAEECIAGGGPADAGLDASHIDASDIDASDIDASTIDASTIDAGPIDAAPIDAMPPPPTKNVTVTLMGSGASAGHVVSSPPGIDCPGTCTASFLQSATVTLTASGGAFLGWEGPCAADLDASCALSSTASATVPAYFGISGKAEWLIALNNSGPQVEPQQVTTFANGDVLVAMTYAGNATFRGQALPGTGGNRTAVLIARLNALTGVPKWQRVLKTDDSVTGDHVRVTSAGDLVLFGRFDGVIDTGSAQHTAVGETTDLLLIKLSGGTGTTLWSKAFGSSADDGASGLGADSAGNIVIATGCTADISFGGNTLTPTEVVDICVAKLSGANGAHTWSTSSKALGEDSPKALAVDAAGDVVLLADHTKGGKFFAGPVLPAPVGSVGAILIKLRGADGAFLIGKTFGGADGAGASALSTDTSSNINLLFNNFDAAETSTLVRLSAIGTESWRKTIPGFSRAVEQSGTELHLTGQFSGTMTLNALSVTSVGSSDGYLAVLRTSDGLTTRLQRFGGSSIDEGMQVAVGSKGQRYAVGQFHAIAEFFGLNASSQFIADGFLFVLTP